MQDIPQIYTVVRSTWLSKPPAKSAAPITLTCLLLLALGCALYWSRASERDWISATRAQVFNQGEAWRLWTTVFAHADIGHLIANSLMFFVLGYSLVAYFGPRVFPLAALFMGGITNAISLLTYPPDTRLVGASGVVSWMGGAWLTLYFLLNTKVSKSGRALRSIAVGLVLFAPSEAFDPKISYRTHSIGFVLGVVWAYLYYQLRKREFLAAEVRETVIE